MKQPPLGCQVLTDLQAFTAAFLSYYLVKLLPMWGMALLSTCVIYLLPLIYVSNKELIDGHLENTGRIISEQTQQVKAMAGEHAGKGFETVKTYTNDYTNKASEYVGKSRQKIPAMSGQSQTQSQSSVPSTQTQSQPQVQENNFPSAPRSELPSDSPITQQEPLPAT